MNFEYWWEICTFAGRMKKFLMNISAALLVVWYCLSIIGFDVHTCVSSGRTFIAAFTDSVACADIHPEHHCYCASCSSSHHEDNSEDNNDHMSVDAESCCSNEYHAIQLSGCRTGDDSDERFTFGKVSDSCIIDIPVLYIASAKYHAEHIQFLERDSGVMPPGDICATFGVWRI